MKCYCTLSRFSLSSLSPGRSWMTGDGLCFLSGWWSTGAGGMEDGGKGVILPDYLLDISYFFEVLEVLRLALIFFHRLIL